MDILIILNKKILVDFSIAFGMKATCSQNFNATPESLPLRPSHY